MKQARGRRFRGQPLVALALLVSIWVSTRTALWTQPFESVAAMTMAPVGRIVAAGRVSEKHIERPQDAVRPTVAAPIRPDWTSQLALAAKPVVPVQPSALFGTEAVTDVQATPPSRLAIIAGHQMLWLAALGQLPVPMAAMKARPPASSESPWRIDGWLMLRQGSAGAVSGGVSAPSLGASQAGAVLRYRLAPSSGHRPSLYLRASSALHAPRGEEIAAGFATRPLPRLPLSALAEVRATRTSGGTITRPAVMLVSEFDPLWLPFDLRAETYAQAGYVGGRDGTAFIDAQMRVERPLLRSGRLELRAGAGMWGGAQKGASRLDIGPSASLDLPVGAGNSRLSADWRFRITGNAAPGSGPALTLSAGF